MWPLVIFARFYFFYFLTQVENSNFILKISGTRRTTDAIDVSHLTSPSTFSFFFLSFLSLSRCWPSHLFKLLSRDTKKKKNLCGCCCCCCRSILFIYSPRSFGFCVSSLSLVSLCNALLVVDLLLVVCLIKVVNV